MDFSVYFNNFLPDLVLTASGGIIQRLVYWIHPFLWLICLLSAWLFIGLMGWSLWSALSISISNARRMHKVPCVGCRFYTGDYRLKCTIHPRNALSEAAICCPDFDARC